MPAGAWVGTGLPATTPPSAWASSTAWGLELSLGTSAQMPVLSPWRQALGCVQRPRGCTEIGALFTGSWKASLLLSLNLQY